MTTRNQALNIVQQALLPQITTLYALSRNEISLNEDEIEYDGEVLYQLKCVEDDIPYFGFFESIYSHEHPFCLPDI